MEHDLELLTERFDKSLKILMHNLGPHFISRAKLGLTPGQVFMLHFIQIEGQCSVSKLAEKMEVAPSAITVMLDRLENHELVYRTRKKEDRRVVMIGITDEGQKKLNYVLAERKAIMEQCFSKMDSDELQVLIQSMEKLASITQAIEIK